jgi:uncharacterized membrane protein YuzA (DUF378 family)
MPKKLTGYILAVIGFIGFGFFRNYKGYVIPLSTLWFLGSIIIGLAGLYLIYTSKSVKLSKQEKYNKERLGRLKKSGERVLLTSDNCEIRENNYYEEVVNESSSKAQKIDALYDPNRNYKANYVQQSAIIYTYTAGDQKIKMTSQPFLFDAKTLVSYIERKMISLYINRFDKKDYMFEIVG